MTANGWLQIAIFFALILICVKPLGSFIATVIEGRKNFLTPVLGPVERLIYRVCGVKEDEEQHWTRYAGALLAFSGLLLLTTPAGTSWQNLFTSIGLGDLLTLACAIAFAGHLLALAHTSHRVPTVQLATLQIGAAALIMAITLPMEGEPHLTVTPRLFIALAVTSLLATAAAFTVQSWAQQHIPPTHTAILLTLEPVFATLTSILVLHERFGRRSLCGAFLILSGIAFTELLSSPETLPVHPV